LGLSSGAPHKARVPGIQRPLRANLDRFQLAFINDTLMRLASALDAILYFAAAFGEFPENLIVSSGR
jgi:hypothetical protein